MNNKQALSVILTMIFLIVSIYVIYIINFKEFNLTYGIGILTITIPATLLCFYKCFHSSSNENSHEVDNINQTIENSDSSNQINISGPNTGDINVDNKVENHYHSKNKPKNLTNQEYVNYLNLFQAYLEKQLRNTISRRLSKDDSDRVEFSLKIANEKDKNKKLDSYTDLLSLDKSTVILSEPGGGKTYLLSMLAKHMIENPLVKNGKIPILLNAKNWSISYSSISNGIKKELRYRMDIDIDQIEQELREGKYLLLIDGLDEVTESLDLLIEEILKLSEIGDIQIIITCRKENYHKQFHPFFDEFVIEKLDDKQIREYVKKELDQSGWNFLYGIEGSLKNLLYTPLFLFMTVSILKKYER